MPKQKQSLRAKKNQQKNNILNLLLCKTNHFNIILVKRFRQNKVYIQLQIEGLFLITMEFSFHSIQHTLYTTMEVVLLLLPIWPKLKKMRLHTKKNKTIEQNVVQYRRTHLNVQYKKNFYKNNKKIVSRL